MGYEDEVREIQDLYLDGKKDEAAARIPTELVEQLALIGPADKLRARPRSVARVDRHTTLLVTGDRETIRTARPELLLGLVGLLVAAAVERALDPGELVEQRVLAALDLVLAAERVVHGGCDLRLPLRDVLLLPPACRETSRPARDRPSFTKVK